jgi:hypothetical protein
MNFSEIKNQAYHFKNEFCYAIEKYFDNFNNCVSLCQENIFVTFIDNGDRLLGSGIDRTITKLVTCKDILLLAEDILNELEVQKNVNTKLNTYYSNYIFFDDLIKPIHNFDINKSFFELMDSYKSIHILSEDYLEKQFFQLRLESVFLERTNTNYMIELFNVLRNNTIKSSWFPYKEITFNNSNNVFVEIEFLFGAKINKLF